MGYFVGLIGDFEGDKEVCVNPQLDINFNNLVAILDRVLS
tara:strand:- start:1339 stop:1458 length:120 start_codon:yes stop_codon:yes gene_type:complete